MTGIGVNVDRLSALPVDILDHILSSVDFVDVVRTCVLSRRWRNVWRYVTCLNLDLNGFTKRNSYNEPEPEPEPEPELEQEQKPRTESEKAVIALISLAKSEYKSKSELCMFWNFIHEVFLQRNNSKVQRINLVSRNNDVDDIATLLCFAGENKLQELCIVDNFVGHYEDHYEQELNFTEELCDNLESLTLDYTAGVCLRVATSFRCLKNLFLTGVFILADDAEKIFSGDSVKLEDVSLQDIEVEGAENVTFSANKLRRLKITNKQTRGFYVNGIYSKLSIRAPNLVLFSYIGHMLRGFAFLDTVSLQQISIQPFLDLLIQGDLSPSARFIGLNHAKSLTLSSHIVKYFSPELFDPLGSTFVLDNLNYLKLGVNGNKVCIEGLINLLKISPNIETLAIEFPESILYNPFVPQWKSSRGSSRVDINCLTYHVKNVQVFNYDNSLSAFELVKFLYLNGKALQNVQIISSLGGRVEKNHFNKIAHLPVASNGIRLCFPSPKPHLS